MSTNNHTNARVLVVDDEEDIREFVSQLLEEEGYEVETAADGYKALSIVQKGYQPDLIFLDMRMPIMDGPTFVETYRNLPGVHAPIVVLSATANVPNLINKVKPAACLTKPFDLTQLLEIAQRIKSVA